MSLARQLYDLWNYTYSLIESPVLEIIDSKYEDTKLIENYLDLLLGIPTDEGYELFQNLCTYYSTINKQYAEEYQTIWKEIYEDDDLNNQKQYKIANKKTQNYN